MTYEENVELNNQNMEIDIDSRDDKIEICLENSNTVYTGTKNYEELSNKPQINGVTLIGNKTSKDIKVQEQMDEITEQDIDNIIFG